jgi:hypothetical protein
MEGEHAAFREFLALDPPEKFALVMYQTSKPSTSLVETGATRIHLFTTAQLWVLRII